MFYKKSDHTFRITLVLFYLVFSIYVLITINLNSYDTTYLKTQVESKSLGLPNIWKHVFFK